ncbi:MAG: hypothetical protein KDK40_01040, partial [Chlamydiia bacterium]|nr:hypothetical protein [Chlamydiia bacterium]
PYRVIGYSLGGLVAIELSRLMIEEGDLVDFLGLIDTYGPGYPLLAPLHQRIFIHIRNLVRASWVDRNKYLIKRFDNLFRRFHSAIGMPHDQNPDIPGLEDPVSRELYLSHEKAWDEYRARPLDLEMHLFRAENDPKDPGTDYSDLYMGWSPYFPKGIHLHRVPGNHFSLFSQSNIKTLAKEIENSYGRALLLDNR